MKTIFGWIKKLFTNDATGDRSGESHCGYAGLCSPVRQHDVRHGH